MRNPPLLMISGHLCDDRVFRDVTRRVACGGGSRVALPPDAATVDEMAEELVGAAPERFAVVGFGLGGVIAMAMVAHWPERLCGAALIASDPHAAHPQEIAYREHLVEAAQIAGPSAYVDALLANAFLHRPSVAARIGPELRDMALVAAEDRLAREARALSRRPDRIEALTTYAEPVEAIVGGRDKVYPPPLSEAIAGAAPRGRFSQIGDAGHMAPLESSESVATAIELWLMRLEAESPR